jgi:hypothetical protein
VFTTLLISIQAQQFKNNVGAPFVGLNAYSNATNVLAMQSNVASLGNITNAGAGLFAERRFGLSELNNIVGFGALATKAGGIGITINSFGNSSFNERQLGLGYGRALNKNISIGAKINYYTVQLPLYGNSNTVNAEAGVLLHLTNKLTSGISVFNPTGGKYGVNNSEKLSAVYKLGIGYDVSNKVNLAGEIIKTENEKISFVGMLHYHFEQKFFARAGISSAANTFFASAGILLGKKLRAELSTSYHQQLGFTPGVILVFQ